MVELLPRLMRGVTRYESNALTRGVITLPQLWALESLSRQADVPMHTLASALGISKPAATAVIDRLLAQRFVTRTRDAQDRRVVRAAITPKGRRILATIWAQKRRTIVQVFGRLSVEDRANYLRILERVVETLGAP